MRTPAAPFTGTVVEHYGQTTILYEIRADVVANLPGPVYGEVMQCRRNLYSISRQTTRISSHTHLKPHASHTTQVSNYMHPGPHAS